MFLSAFRPNLEVCDPPRCAHLQAHSPAPLRAPRRPPRRAPRRHAAAADHGAGGARGGVARGPPAVARHRAAAAVVGGGRGGRGAARRDGRRTPQRPRRSTARRAGPPPRAARAGRFARGRHHRSSWLRGPRTRQRPSLDLLGPTTRRIVRRGSAGRPPSHAHRQHQMGGRKVQAQSATEQEHTPGGCMKGMMSAAHPTMRSSPLCCIPCPKS